jgi:hypothetical protein
VSVFDGSDEDLSFAEVLIYMAERVSWPTEIHKRHAVAAIRAEFGLELPEPDNERNLNDSRDVTLRNQDAELADLNKRLAMAEKRREVAEAERDAERAEREASSAAQVVPGGSVPAAWVEPVLSAEDDTKDGAPAETVFDAKGDAKAPKKKS